MADLPITENTQKKKNNYTYAHGRRKEAVARVRLFKGSGESQVNDMPQVKYFPTLVDKTNLQKPFIVTKTEGKYFATIRVSGSGKKAQLQAVIHGLSRALVMEDNELKPILRKAGLLTRDPRAKERRKYGMAQKARKGKQSPKR